VKPITFFYPYPYLKMRKPSQRSTLERIIKGCLPLNNHAIPSFIPDFLDWELPAAFTVLELPAVELVPSEFLELGTEGVETKVNWELPC
jgi:hypothetical protein